MNQHETMPAIVTLVEGQSEVEALPVLLRRLLLRLDAVDVTIARPFRVKRYGIVRPGELERAAQQALRSRDHAAALLLLLDADDDCPVELASQLLARCRECVAVPSAVVAANRELESWFLGAKESLRGLRGIRPDASAPEAPESIRGAKERLSRNMTGNRYVEIDDQPAFAQKMDLDSAIERCPSFAKLCRSLEQLVSQLA